MSALLKEVEADGLHLTLTPTGAIKVNGKRELVEKWAATMRERKPELVAELQKGVHGVHGVHAFPSPPASTLYEDGFTGTQAWEQWQIAHPSTGTVPLTKTEARDIRDWLDVIGETDRMTVEDVIRICEAFPDTRQHCLNEARTSGVRKVIATRLALSRAAAKASDDDLASIEQEAVTDLADRFYNHLFGPAMATRCCHAPRNRFCSTGKKLRDAYSRAAKAHKSFN